jgi:hypothetical protein
LVAEQSDLVYGIFFGYGFNPFYDADKLAVPARAIYAYPEKLICQRRSECFEC